MSPRTWTLPCALCLLAIFSALFTIPLARPTSQKDVASASELLPNDAHPQASRAFFTLATSNSFYSFRDDFNYASLNASLAAGWKECGGGPPSLYSISNGVLTMQNDGSHGASFCWTNIPIGVADWTVTSKIEWAPKSPYEQGTLDMIVNTGRHSYNWMADGFSYEYKLFRDGQFVWTSINYAPTQNTWHTMRMDMHNGNVTIFFDGNLQTTYFETDLGTYLAGITLNAGWEATDSFDYVSAQQLIPSTPDFVATPTAVSQKVSTGQNANFTVTLASVNGFSGHVTVQPSYSGPPSSSSPSDMILRLNGSNTTAVSIHTSTALQGTYYVPIQFTSGNLQHTVVLTVTVIGPLPGQDFALLPEQSEVTVVEADNGSWPAAVFRVDITSIGGFSGPVQLYVPSVWNGGYAYVTPNIVYPTPGFPTNATITVTRTPLNPPGAAASIDIYVSGQNGDLSHLTYVRAVFQVPDFALIVSPNSLAMTPGQHGSTSVRIIGSFFSGLVFLTASVQPFFLGGPTFSLSASSVSIANDSIGQATLVVATSQNTPLQTYTVYINGTGKGRYESAALTLFVISHEYTPGVSVGNTATYTLTVSNSTLPLIQVTITIISISSSNVTFTADIYEDGIFANSTQTWTDVATGKMGEPIIPFFLAPTNLNPGSPVYLDPALAALRITSEKNELALGAIRKQVIFENSNPISTAQVTWDQTTGVMTSLDASITANSTSIEIHYRLVSTDAWTSLKAGIQTTQTPQSNLVGFKASVVGGTAPFSYQWTFGDGISSATANPSHQYTRNGQYTVSLEVTDSLGNRAVASRIVTLGQSTTPQKTPPTISGTTSFASWARSNSSWITAAFVGLWGSVLLLAFAIVLHTRSRHMSRTLSLLALATSRLLNRGPEVRAVSSPRCLTCSSHISSQE